MKDQPMTGVEKVVWWTEYVIRNNGAPYLKNPRADMSWFDFFMLDVIAFLFGVVVITLFFLYRLLIFICGVFHKNNRAKSKTQ